MARYQLFKLQLQDIFGISRDGFHIFLGFAVFLLFAAAFKLKLSSWKTLIAPAIFAVILELLDIRDALAFGYAPDLPDSLQDIIVTTILPFITIVYLRFASKQKQT